MNVVIDNLKEALAHISDDNLEASEPIRAAIEFLEQARSKPTEVSCSEELAGKQDTSLQGPSGARLAWNEQAQPEPVKKPTKFTESAIVSDGKYEFQLFDDDWRVHVLRHGKPWLIIEQGHKAIAALVFELIEAKKKPEPGEFTKEIRKDYGCISPEMSETVNKLLEACDRLDAKDEQIDRLTAENKAQVEKIAGIKNLNEELAERVIGLRTEAKAQAKELSLYRSRFCEAHQPNEKGGKVCPCCEAVHQAERIERLEGQKEMLKARMYNWECRTRDIATAIEQALKDPGPAEVGE